MTKNTLSAPSALVHSQSLFSGQTSAPMTRHCFAVLEKSIHPMSKRLGINLIKLSLIVLMMGVILSFHNTLWPLTFWFVVGWAGLAALEYNLEKKRKGRTGTPSE